MKKKKISIICILLFVIIYIAAINEEIVRYIYFHTIKDWILELKGKGDFTYYISVYSNDENMTIDNGKKEKTLEPIKGYNGFDNCIYQYKNGNYFIHIHEGNYISMSKDKDLIFSVNVDFPNMYTVCETLNISGENISVFSMKVEENRITCESKDNMANDNVVMHFGYTKGAADDQVMFGNMDFEIYSFEIRQKEDGTTTAFLDLDGDGIYEHDCSEYTYEYWESLKEENS